MTANNDLMTTAEVSEFLKLNIDTIHKKAQRGQIPVTRMPHSNRLYFSRTKITAWLFAGSETKNASAN